MEKKKICKYCKAPENDERALHYCTLCKQLYCMYHEAPEKHKCENVDWEGLEKKKHIESENWAKETMRAHRSREELNTFIKLLFGAALLIFALAYFLNSQPTSMTVEGCREFLNISNNISNISKVV